MKQNRKSCIFTNVTTSSDGLLCLGQNINKTSGGGCFFFWRDLRQKAKKGTDLSFCVTQYFKFGHALNTGHVRMSYKTDKYAHRTNTTSESWPALDSSQNDVDL